MSGFALLDLLAELHNPLLGLIAAALIVSAALQRRRRLALLRVAGALTALSVVYATALLDQRLEIWPALGLDYATHIAVALAAATYLTAQAPRLWAIWTASFGGYAWLVVHLRHHTPDDLVSTCLAVGVPLAAAAWWIGRASHGLPVRA